MNYGAWYLPVNTWSSSNSAGGQAGGGRGAGRDGAVTGGGGPVGDASVAAGGSGEANNSMELLPKLYSSRIYKEYLAAQHIHRIPHYLAHVESPKLPARRANISLLEVSTQDAAEGSP